MKKWNKNERGFKITFDNGLVSSVQGPNLTPDNLRLPQRFTDHYKIVKVEEYFYEDAIKWQIENHQKQIEICLQEIKNLTADLETA